ncbi:MAG: NAD(P)-dependent glycerol-3-phosphate dehydrogenase [Rhodobacterales bacterium]|nr:NAD(P)-dependent glycerol-3-phosphate dehydrogenase [Rhodobacterales bacterium]NCT13579.1 NAD(P)-dependent glycerol-3-phosphate dehydrogenase [Rhodobacterales bacterium]
MSVMVLGAGAFGTALAVSLARGGVPVTLWARDVTALRDTRQSPHLPGVTLPQNVAVSAEIETVLAVDTVLVALPAQALRPFLEAHAALLAGRAIIACCKGIDLGTLIGPVATIRAAVPGATAAILTGPSFAADIAAGLPTALTLACADDAACRALQQQLATPALRLYRSADTVGAELGGALKNVIALACGACIGAGLGESARAALMTRGFAEMQRLAASLGAQPETLLGLSGFGDLVLTCTSPQSRNFRFGHALGRGEPFDPTTTVEGVATAKAVSSLAQEHRIDLPVCAMTARLAAEEISVSDAMRTLLSRPLKEE